LQDNGRCEPMLQILQLLSRDTNVLVCPIQCFKHAGSPFLKG